MSFLTQQRRYVARIRHPGISLVIETEKVSPNVNSPKLVFARFITQGFEGNGNFDRPSVTGQHSLRFHDDVDAEVPTRALRHDSVLLYAECVPAKDVRTALIVEGIEKE